jgi:hypothetical protein
MHNFAVLDKAALQKFAPSIFAEGGSHRTSDKYQHISTIEVIDALACEGFMPVKATQSRSRIEEKKGYAKHCVRFRHVDTMPTVGGGLFPELILTNSHDGLSSYKLQSGLFRLVCTNGMVSGEMHKQVRVRHQGDIVGQVIDGTYEVMSEASGLLEQAEEMGALILDPEEKQIFSEAVHQLYFGEEESNLKTAITADQFLKVRRSADRPDNLFTVFNRAQENVIRGGLSGYYRDEKRQYKRTTTRAVNSIDKNNSLNQALWTLAEKMAELKRA